jgi:hypothetical protein
MNIFEYGSFCEVYEQLKKTIGSLDDTGTSTVGGVINQSNTDITKGLDYAADSSWASSKLDSWNEMLPGLKTNFENLIVLLNNAKNAADKYNEFEKSNQGM